MKIFAIYDRDLDRKQEIGYLYCYEKANEYIIELSHDLDEWEAPLLFQSLVSKGIYTIPRDISALWVKERVIPSSRQNIALILKNARLKEYNEISLLSLSKGHCSQDECYIEEIAENDIPGEIKDRSKSNVSECLPTEDSKIICLFNDNVVSKVDLNSIVKDNKEIRYVLNNKQLFYSVKVGVGGYSIVFNDTIEIPKKELRKNEWILPIKADDFYNFVNINVVSSAHACGEIQCSRQNLSYMVKAQKIKPIVYGTKENFYTKGEIQRFMDN